MHCIGTIQVMYAVNHRELLTEHKGKEQFHGGKGLCIGARKTVGQYK